MRVARADRSFTAVVLLMLLGAWVSRGYCPMMTAAQGKTESHDCCKTGLSGKTASCCHADDAANTLVTSKSSPTTASHVPSAFAWNPTLPFQTSAHVRTPNSAHSPPRTILRI